MGQGPLSGLRVVEFAGLGPAPFGGMLLSDLGADVVRIDRLGPVGFIAPDNPSLRGRRSVALNLKAPGAVEACLRLIEGADALIEGYRPGVMERLGLGPEPALARNPKLVYGRMTGWGQTGPLAQRAGHDLNYIGLTGALAAIGTRDKPIPPLNLLGDFGGGALYLAFGLLAGVIHARATGQGQVIDCAIVDGTASLLTMTLGLRAADAWSPLRRDNALDGGAAFYDTYQCADGRWLSVAPIEHQFYAELLQKLGLEDEHFERHASARDHWPAMREKIAAVIATRSQAEWAAIFDDVDACVAPILDFDEAARHPHMAEREVYVEPEGVLQPAPAPRFSATPGAIQRPPPSIGAHNDEALADWGFTEADLAQLRRTGALTDPPDS